MKVKGFGAWPSRNVSSGGQRSSFDEYNRALKGSERNPSAEEYASRNIEGYHHYSEIQDLTKDQDQKKDSKSRKDNSKSRRQRMIQQVAVLAVGSVMIVTTYNAQVAKRAEQQAAAPNDAVVDVDGSGDGSGDNGLIPDIGDTQSSYNADKSTKDSTKPTEGSTQAASTAPTQSSSSSPGSGTSSGTSSGTNSGTSTSSNPSSSSGSSSNTSSNPGSNPSPSPSSSPSSNPGTSTSVSWSWSANNKSATLVVTDSSGKVVSEIPASVTSSTTAATCNKAGRITYTASATANGKTYTDTRNDTIAALGHAFDSGKEVTLADGRTATQFECTRCHEKFTIVNTVDEE